MRPGEKVVAFPSEMWHTELARRNLKEVIVMTATAYIAQMPPRTAA